jgi:hypothetical protein
MRRVWSTKIPLAVRFFLWRMYYDKLQTAEQLKRREWRGEINCQLCGKVEDMNHIMFICVCNRYVWLFLNRRLVGLILEDLLIHWAGFVSGKGNRLVMFGLGAVCCVFGRLEIKWPLRGRWSNHPR